MEKLKSKFASWDSRWPVGTGDLLPQEWFCQPQTGRAQGHIYFFKLKGYLWNCADRNDSCWNKHLDNTEKNKEANRKEIALPDMKTRRKLLCLKNLDTGPGEGRQINKSAQRVQN